MPSSSHPQSLRRAALPARLLFLLSKDPVYGPLVSPAAVDPTLWFLQALTLPEARLYGFLNQAWLQRVWRQCEDWRQPGGAVTVALRKRWIENQVRAELEQGAVQAVVLGAGFDTLAYRLNFTYARARWIEVDDPDVQVVKRLALERRGGVTRRFAFLPVRMDEPGLSQVLSMVPGYSARARTVFMLENLLSTLTQAQAAALLQSLRASGGPESALVGSVCAPTRGAWGLAEADLAGFLASAGFDLIQTAHPRDLLPEYLPGAPLPRRFASSEYCFWAGKKL